MALSDTKLYLGDGVYVQQMPFGSGLVLTAEDGIIAHDTIFLELEVVHALIKYIETMRGHFYAASEQG